MALPSGIFTIVKWCLSPLGSLLCWNGVCILTMVKWCLSPFWSLPIGRSLGRSGIKQKLDWEISMKTCLVSFSLFSRISTCSGDMDLNRSGFLSISLVMEINRAIVGSIGISGFLSWYWSGDRESDWGFDQDTVTETVFVQLLGILSLGRSHGRSGVWSGDRKLDQSGVLLDLDLLGDLLGDLS